MSGCVLGIVRSPGRVENIWTQINVFLSVTVQKFDSIRILLTEVKLIESNTKWKDERVFVCL